MSIKRFIKPWYLFATVILIAVSFRVSPALAAEAGKHTEPIGTILQEVLTNQNADVVQNLDCAKVNDEDFERLGDAFMEDQHPGEAHEAMDRMMGGEGSETLKQAHIQMGKNYLGCSQDGWGMGMMPMMFGMQNNTGGGESNMMGFGSYGSMMGGFGIVFAIFWIIILVDLVLLGFWLWKQIQKK